MVDDADRGMAMVTVQFEGLRPKPEDVAERLGVTLADIDDAFGIVPIDPSTGRYAVRVRANKLARGEADRYGGPHADPPIEPFGADE